MSEVLPPIPAKRYFTIGEVAELCGVKTHVLRYWEQEFTQLRPVKRRGNRRYYQHHEVLMIRRIRDLLYEQGFTISGARNKLQEFSQPDRLPTDVLAAQTTVTPMTVPLISLSGNDAEAVPALEQELRQELQEIRMLLTI